VIRNKTAIVLRVILAVVFFASAVTKLAAPGLLEIILIDHGIAATREIAAILVRVLIGFEFSLALLLLQPNYLKKFVLPLVFLFLADFTAYLIYAGFILKDHQNCGCFGAVVEMSPVESIIKNIVLLLLTFILYRKTKEEGKKIILPLILFCVSFPIVFTLSPITGGKDFLFNKYTDFIEAGRVDLAQGEKLVFIFSLDCDHCQQTARDVIELKKKFKLPDIYVLFFQENDVTVNDFKSKTGFSAPYKILPGEEFFELVGSTPPRCYHIKNGKISEFWDTNIKENLFKIYSDNKN
jgi:hypothetical protein